MAGKYERFRDVPQLIGWGTAPSSHVPWVSVERWIQEHQADYGEAFHLCPDFQRGHVWTERQQIAFVEFGLRGGQSGMTLFWNDPAYMGGSDHGSAKDMGLVLVDGLQRITAVRRFMNNEIPAFGGYCRDYKDRPDRMSTGFLMVVNRLETRAEVLRWYLELNTGGVVHSDEEIRRVRQLLRKEEKRDQRSEAR